MKKVLSNSAIIADTLGRGPDATIASPDGSWELSRWRQFLGDYTLPAMPDPSYVIHLAGKPSVRTWDRNHWSKSYSIPGCATIVPAGQKTGWLVDGELDVITLTLAPDELRNAPAAEQFERMRFAFSDPLSAALAKQAIAELYAPRTPEQEQYLTTLINALKAHVMRGTLVKNPNDIPINTFAAHRIHQIVSMVLSNPERTYTIDELAERAGVTIAHFCRIFKQGTGLSPHRFVMKAKLERAQQLLDQSTLPVNLIADQLGFTSQSHFTRAFRSFTGLTPTEHRTRSGSLIQ